MSAARNRLGGHRRVPAALVWVIATVPWALLAITLVHPALRARLLGPANLRSAATTPVAPRRSAGSTDLGRRGGTASRPPPATPKTVGLTLGGSGVDPSRRTVSPTGEGGWRSLSGAAIATFLEASYGERLPPAVGPIEARVDDGRMTIVAPVDLDALQRSLDVEVPASVEPFLGGRPRVAVSVSIAASGAGLVRIRVEDVRVGVLRIPEGVLAELIRGRMERAGRVTTDPLLWEVMLPPGYSAAVLEGATLRLQAEPTDAVPAAPDVEAAGRSSETGG